MARRPQSAREVVVCATLAAVAGLVGCSADPGLEQAAETRSSGDYNPRPSNEGAVKGPKGPLESGFRVTRVIDGDTVEVRDGRRSLTVRLIGIDTPETVHPTERVECFGPAATRFANDRLLGHRVSLEYDPSQGRRDYYGRTLAYLWIGTDTTLFNLAAIRHGLALEYTYDSSYAWQSRFVHAERMARGQKRGVWSCPRPGS